MRLHEIADQLQFLNPASVVLTAEDYKEVRRQIDSTPPSARGDFRISHTDLWYRSAPIIQAPYSQHSYILEDRLDGPVIHMLR